jgi:hypothetical protein
MKLKRLIINHSLEAFLSGLEIIPSPVKGVVALWLCLLIMKAFKIGVFQGLFYCITLFRVENKHLAQQVKCNWITLGVKT